MDGLLKPKFLSVSSLLKPSFYSRLYPLGRDYSPLREVIRLQGFKFEKALAVRHVQGSENIFEILAGTGRKIIAEERNIKNLWAFVTDNAVGSSKLTSIDMDKLSNAMLGVLREVTMEHDEEWCMP